jgi:FtsZ-interacting cell division protein ZipA
MPVSNLQLALIVAGALLVIGVIIFNHWQERRIRRRIDAAFRKPEEGAPPAAPRVEPTLRSADAGQATAGTGRPPRAGDVPAVRAGADVPGAVDPGADFAPPLEVIEHPDVGAEAEAEEAADAVAARPAAERDAPVAAPPAGHGFPADPDTESIVILQPIRPQPVAALAAGMHGRFGKPVRWFGRDGEAVPWQALSGDTPGAFAEFAACMLLADRNGPASRAQLATFERVLSELAQTMPAAIEAPEPGAEAARAEMLDRLCAELDVQIGLTLLKSEPATIAGTRLRGVAEAAGFRLSGGGRFEYVNEDTGSVEYSLANLRADPFTAEWLRANSTPGVVLVLDVPRVADPVRAFDRMKLAARRMAQTLGATIVDDNQRSLDDAALAAIRAQVDGAAQALVRAHIAPGSARALALFGA